MPAAEIARARKELVAPTRWLAEGTWEEPATGGRLGFLIVDGLLARDLVLAGHTCTELLGEGDVLQPGANPREDRLVRYHVLWHVLEPLRVAILDDQFARALDRRPQVAGALLERAIRRSIRMSVHQALLQLSPVETRLVVLLWFLAERWGRMTREGVTLRLPLSHQLLGQLVGCRRASVTTALGHVREQGHVTVRSDGAWLLTGQAPDELSRLRWERAAASAAPLMA